MIRAGSGGGMRVRAVVCGAVIALCACEGPLGTVGKPGEGTGGAGGEGAIPLANKVEIDPATVHPGVELEEDALQGAVAGEIAQMSSTRVIVQDADGHRFWLTLTPDTVITQNGRPTSALSLKDGEKVTATFITDSGRRVMTRAELSRP